MKALLAALMALGLFAAPLHAQTVTAPTAPVGAADDDDCDDDNSTANEDDDCPAFLLLDNGLGGAAIPLALVGTAAVIGIIAIATSNDSSNSTTGTGGDTGGDVAR